jgi:predicted ATPase
MLLSALEGRELLLVLDNFEQLLGAAPLVAEILENAPRLRLLATSRIPLRISGEHEYQVAPLTLPPTSAGSTYPVDPNTVSSSEAVTLFVDRVRQFQSEFAIDEHNASTVAAICAKLDGLPLALELAAPRLKLLSPQTLLDRLEHGLPDLAGAAVDVPARQQTLMATLDWSYALLSDDDRHLFAQLAVFVDGWTLDAAEEVCAETADVVTTMGRLLDNSLVRRRSNIAGEPRFDMLSTIHAYALERLESSGARPELAERHANHFLDVAELADRDSKGTDEARRLERLELDHDNLRAALAWFHEAGDPEPELRLANALTRFWWLRGHTSEARRRLEEALSRPGEQPPQLRTEALRRAAVLAGVQGDYDVAKTLAEESRAFYEEFGDRRGIAMSVSTIAEAYLHEGNYEQARPLYEQARSLFRDLGDEWDLAAAAVNLGYVALGEGRYREAFALAEEGLSRLRELGDTNGTATAVYVLGAAALRQDDHERATAHLRESLELFCLVGDKEGTAECLYALAAARASEAPEIAAELTGAAEALHQESGSALAQFQLDWRDRTVADIRRQIGDQEWSRAYRRGRDLNAEAVIAHAMN